MFVKRVGAPPCGRSRRTASRLHRLSIAAELASSFRGAKSRLRTSRVVATRQRQGVDLSAVCLVHVACLQRSFV